MLRFITSRFLQSLLALFLVMSATFFMVRFVPGGPFTAEKAVTPEILRNLEAQESTGRLCLGLASIHREAWQAPSNRPETRK